MPRFELSEQDLDLVEHILEELDVACHEVFPSEVTGLDTDETAFVFDHVRRKLRSAIEIGLMARAFAHDAMARELCDERGAGHFMSSKAWLHNFGVSETSDEYFYALSMKSGSALGRGLDALIEFAQDRAFGTMDEEYRGLFTSEL